MIYRPDSPEFRVLCHAYKLALLWTTESNPDAERSGQFAPDHYTLNRFTRAARVVCDADCLEFLNRVQCAGLARWVWQKSDGYMLPGYGAAEFGHDLALSRNGHGAGFFDRDALDRPHLGRPPADTLANVLQDIARSMGERGLYPAGGWIHCS